jgi:Coenzyme PQQ synthesis protein D (PqqD)
MNPIARSTGLTSKKLGDELVVFDSTNGSVHHLNRVAEMVWRACDGRTDAAALARLVARNTQVTDAGPAVELALEQLSRRGLLQNPVERADVDRRRDRRQALKQLATALAIPTIMTLTAQRAMAVAFVSGDGCLSTLAPIAGLTGCTTADGKAGHCGVISTWTHRDTTFQQLGCVAGAPIGSSPTGPVTSCQGQPNGTPCSGGTFTGTCQNGECVPQGGG